VTCVVCRNEIEGLVPNELIVAFAGETFPTCCGPCAEQLVADPAAFLDRFEIDRDSGAAEPS
jgi:hypothetical protein